jgi:hypothetical protein
MMSEEVITRDKREIKIGKDRIVEVPVDEKNRPIIDVEPDAARVYETLYRYKYNDGLAVLNTTEEAVQNILRYTDKDPDEVIAILPPLNGVATVEKIAINSWMAGIIPGYYPPVEFAISASAEDKFNLKGIIATTHPVTIATIVNGPLKDELVIYDGAGCLGPGFRANASIGRAIRLSIMNIGGGLIGIGDLATHGTPAKFTCCFGENESENPWEPLHVERGFKRDTSTVTVVGIESFHNINQHRGRTAEEILMTIAHTMATAGSNNAHIPSESLLILSPEHARDLERGGYGKKEIREVLYDIARLPAELADKGGTKLNAKFIDKYGNVPVMSKPEDLIIVVAGGPGRQSMYCPTFGATVSVTKAITLKDGTPVYSAYDFVRAKKK